jgi:hypothetical protein
MAMRPKLVIGAVSVFALVGVTMLGACGSDSSVNVGDGASGPWRVLEPSPLSARTDATALWTGREVVVFGGTDLQADESSSRSDSSVPETALAATTTSGPAASVVPVPIPPPTRPASVKVDGAAYDPAAGTWRTIAPAPVPDGYAPRSITGDGDRVTVLFGRAYGCGLDDPTPDPAGAWYDAGADAWSAIPASPLPYTCVPAGAWSGGKLWVFEGTAGAVYDPTVGTWETVASPSSAGGAIGALHAMGDVVVALGAAPSGAPEEVAPTFALFDPATRTWSDLPAPPLEVSGPSVIAGDRLFVFDPGTSAAASWEPASQTWTRLPDAPIATRTGNATVAVGDRLVVWGGVEAPRRVGRPSGAYGFEPGAPLQGGAMFDPSTGSWTTIADSPVPGRMDAAAVGTDDELFAWGGQLIEPTDTGSHPVVRTDGARFQAGASTDTPPIDPVATDPTSTDPGTSGPASTTTHPGTAAPGTTVPAMTTVYAAAGPITRGTTGEDVVAQALVVPEQIPLQFAPTTAILTLDVLPGKVALFDMAPGTIIVEGMFIDPPPD